jgi:hypothetical protein
MKKFYDRSSKFPGILKGNFQVSKVHTRCTKKLCTTLLVKTIKALASVFYGHA